MSAIKHESIYKIRFFRRYSLSESVSSWSPEDERSLNSPRERPPEEAEEQEWVVVRAGRREEERNLSIPSPFLCSTGNLFFTLQSWLGHRPLSRNPDLVRRVVS